MLITRREVPADLPLLTHLSPLLQRIYATRGIQSETELNKQLNALLPFETLKDIDKAALRLAQALQLQQRILVIGDFDTDGATSSALAVSALRAMGALHVNYLVPNRFEFGYGLTPGIVEIAAKWRPDVLVTVDNGIASLDGVAAATALGIDVVITDHHLAGETLPEACAIVNPNQPNDTFPSKSIAGVGVIFYVMLALRRELITQQWFERQGVAPPNMAQFLDLVALGTVADVVALDQNNRVLIHQGLSRIRQGQARPGILALLDIAKRTVAQVRESDLGFAVAPRLNAAGRLDDMSLGIECLLSPSFDHARQLAVQLDELNIERRKIEAQMSEQALTCLKQWSWREKTLPLALCLLDESWHQGVIGILAGRLKERYHRPVIVFARVSETELKGSARSIAGLNIRDILARIESLSPGLMTKFGGHAMAAGVTLPYAAFSTFQQAFVTEVERCLHPSQCEGVVESDGSLADYAVSLELAQTLQQAGPWGQNFPEPVFDDVFELLDQRLVGQLHLKLTLARHMGEVLEGIAFNVDLNLWPNHRVRRVHVVYKLDVNVYQGRSRVQLLILQLQPEATPLSTVVQQEQEAIV